MEIVNYIDMPQGSYEIAIFDIYMGQKWGVVLTGFQVLKAKSGHYYVKSSSFRDKRLNTEKPYTQAVDMNSERGKEFAKTVLELVRPMLPAEGSSEMRKPVQDDFPF